MIAIRSRSTMRRRLGVSTALGTGALLIAQPTLAQTLPTGGNVTFGTTATPAPDATGTRMDINLLDTKTVIEWQSFDISNATVQFNNGVALKPPIAVLNRVVGPGGKSIIDGTLGAENSVSVFVVNTAGILFGSHANVSVGSLIASSEAIDNNFTVNSAQFSSGVAADRAIEVNAGASLKAIGLGSLGQGDLVLIGAKVLVTPPALGSTDNPALLEAANADPATDAGEVALVAAENVNLTMNPSSPLAIEITKGTGVEGAFKVNGTLKGRSVTLALATRGSVTDTLLSVSGIATATGAAVTDQGVVLAAGTIAGKVTYATGADVTAAGSASVGATTTSAASISLAAANDLGTTGKLDTSAASTSLARNVALSAGGIATVGGAVASGGDLTVQGASIVLGTTATNPLQSAIGKIDLTATTGGISAAGAPVVTANSGAAAYDVLVNRSIFLDALNGSIDLTGTTLNASNYAVQIRNNSADAAKAQGVTLGAVNAYALTVANAAHDVSRATSTSFTSALVLGATSLDNAEISVAGDATIASLTTAGAATLTTSAGGIANVGAITTTGGNATVDAAGVANVTGAVDVVGDYTVKGASVVLGRDAPVTQSATGTIAITARAGSLSSATGTLAALTLKSDRNDAGNKPITLTAQDGTLGTIDTHTATLLGGATSTSFVQVRSATAANLVTLGNVTALGLQGAKDADPFGNALVRSSALTVGDVTLAQALTLESTASTLTTGVLIAPSISLKSDGLMTVASATANGTAGTVTVGGNGKLVVSGALTASSPNATDIVIDRTGELEIGSLSAARDIKIGQGATQPTKVTVTGATNARDVLVKSSGDQSFTGAITASGNANLASSGGSVSVGTLGATGTTTIDGTGASATSLTGSSVDVTAGTSGASLTALTATSGSVAVTSSGSATVSGAVDAATSYAVTGTSVTLGAPLSAAVAQKAGTTVAIEATGGTLTGRSGLTLQSNKGDAGSDALTLTTSGGSGGDIAFAGTTLLGGATKTADVQVRSRGDANVVTLGTVTARGLLGATGSTALFTAGIKRDSAITVGDVTLAGGLTLDSGSTLTGGNLSASTVTLRSVGLLQADAITSGGFVSITGTGDVQVGGSVSAGGNGNLTVDRPGVLTFGSLSGYDILVAQGTTAATSLEVTGTTTARHDLKLKTTGAQQLRGDAAGDGAVTILAGSLEAAKVTATNGALAITTNTGDLTATGLAAGTNATLIASGLAKLSGAATIGGGYTVRGASVELGSTGTSVLQSAGGSVTIEATGGTLTGRAGLTLQSDANNAGSAPLALATSGSTGGDIAFAGTHILGGPARTSAVQIRSRVAGNAVTLGDVDGSVLQGAVGSLGFQDGLTRSAAITVHDVTLTGALALTAGGALTANALTASSVTLSSAAAMTLASAHATNGATTVSGAGTLDVTGADGLVASGDVTIDRAGALTITRLFADANIQIGPATAVTTVTVSGITHAGGAATIRSSGDQRYDGAVTSGGSTILASGGTLRLDTLLATGAATLSSTGLLSAAAITADGGAVTISGTGALTLTGVGIAATAPLGDIAIDRTGSLTLTGLTAGRDIAVGQTTQPTGVAATGAINAGRDVGIRSSGDQSYGGTITATRNATLESGGTLTLATLTADGAATLNSTGLLTAGTITATGGAVTIGGTGGLTLTDVAGIAATSASLGNIVIDRSGVLELTQVAAGRDLRIGQTVVPTRVSASGTVSAGNDLAVRGSNALAFGAAVSAGHSSTLTGGSITAGSVTASSGVAALTANAGDVDVASLTAGSDATVAASGAAIMRGAVQAGADYRVTGGAVMLGSGATAVLQRAGGSVLVASTTGVIAGGGGLTLRADGAGTGAGTLVLDGAGGIALDPATILQGGTASSGDVGLRAGAGASVALGVIAARRLTGADAAHALTASLVLGGPVTLGGTVTVDRSLDLATTGSIVTRRVAVTGAGQSLSLAANGTTADLTALDALTAPGVVTLRAGRTVSFTTATAGGDAIVTAGGALDGTTLAAGRTATATAGGAVTLATLTGGTGAGASGTSITLGSATTTTGLLDLSATAGDLLVPTVLSGGAVRLAASGDVAIDSASAGTGADLTIINASGVRGTVAGTPATLTAGRDIAVNATGEVRLASVIAGRALTIGGGSLDITGATATLGSASLAAAAGDASIGSLTSGGDAAIVADAGVVRAGTLQAGGGATLRGGSIVLTVGRITDLAQLTSLVGAVTAPDLIAGSVSIAAATDAVLGTIRSTSGALSARAGGALTATVLTAQGAATIAAASLDVETVSSTNGALALTTTAGSLRAGQAAAGGSITLAAAGDSEVDNVVAGTDLTVTTAALRGRANGARTALSAGGNIDLRASGSALIGPVTAGGNTQLVAASVDLGSLTAGSAIVTASSGNLDVAALVVGSAATLTALSGPATLGTIEAGGALTVDAAAIQAAVLRSRGGSVLARARSGDLQVATIDAASDATFRSAGAAQFDTVTSGGNVDIDASRAIAVSRVAAAGAIRAAGASVDAANVSAGTVALTARTGALAVGTVTAVQRIELTKTGSTGAIVATGPLTVGATGDAAITSSTDVTLAAVQAGRDVAIGAGGTVVAPTLSAGRTLFVSAGGDASLVAITAGGAASVIAGGAARIAGAVSAASYTVQGDTVALGTQGSAVRQAATGAVSVRATGGGVNGASGLVLASDSDGDGAGDLVLRGAGGIAFAAGTSVLGGNDRSATVRLEAGAGAPIGFDLLAARTLVSYTPTQDATRFDGAGPLSISTLSLRDAATLRLAGAMSAVSLGTVAAGSAFAFSTDGSLRVSDLTAAGALSLAGTDVAIGTIRGGGAANVAATAGTLRLAAVDAAGPIVLAASGDVRVGTATARSGGLLIAAADGSLSGLDGTTGTVLVAQAQAGDIGVLTGGAAIIATATAGGGLTVHAGDGAVASRDGRIAIGEATTGGVMALTAFNDLAGSAAGITVGRATVGSATIRATGTQGAVVAGPLQAAGTIAFDGTRDVTLTDPVSAGTAFAVAIDGSFTGANIVAGTTLGIAAAQANVARARSGGDMTIRAASIDAGDLASTGGALTLASNGALRLSAGSARGAASLSSGGALTIGTLAASGDVRANASGQLAVDALNAGGAATLQGRGIALGQAAVAGALALTSGGDALSIGQAAGGPLRLAAGGDLRVGSLDATGGGTLTVSGATTIGSLAASGALSLASGGTVTADTIRSGTTLVASGASLAIGAVRSGATMALTASGALALTTIDAGGTATLTANDDASIRGAATIGGDYLVRAGTITFGGAGGSAVQTAAGRVAAVASSGAIRGLAGLSLISGTGGTSLTATGAGGTIDLAAGTIVDGRSLGDLTFEAAGTAALGTATAGSRAITVTAADIALSGPLSAASATFTNRAPANVTRLGDAPSANAAEYGGGATRFDLSAGEFARVTAANVVVDAQGGVVRLGDLALASGTGSSSIQFRTSGRMDVLGRLTAAGSSSARSIILGGGASEADRARVIRVASTSAGGGRILVGSGTLDLRADSIGVGFDSGFLGTLGLSGDTPSTAADVATRFVSQPNSALYNASLTNPLGIYTDPVSIQAGRLVVHYANFALFQNTGRAGTSTGLVLGGSAGDPTSQTLQLLAASGSNAVAVFGTINGIGGTATSLLGNNVLLIGGQVSRANSRANGCLIGAAGGGCLSASLVQPSLNVFDASRAEVFRTAEDLTLPFDPLVGTSNEALFSDIASSVLSDTDDRCPADGKTICPQPGATQ